MKRYRVVVELDEDYLDELCCFIDTDILYVEDVDVEKSGITYEGQEESE